MYLVINATPDFEGISFELEDGTFRRIGADQDYTPQSADHTKLDARLIGM